MTMVAILPPRPRDARLGWRRGGGAAGILLRVTGLGCGCCIGLVFTLRAGGGASAGSGALRLLALGAFKVPDGRGLFNVPEGRGLFERMSVG